jgi:hypothetical protein
MSGKNSKKLRRMVRQYTEQEKGKLLIETIAEVRNWPFKERVSFAWRLVFPKREKPANV